MWATERPGRKKPMCRDQTLWELPCPPLRAVTCGAPAAQRVMSSFPGPPDTAGGSRNKSPLKSTASCFIPETFALKKWRLP